MRRITTGILGALATTAGFLLRRLTDLLDLAAIALAITAAAVLDGLWAALAVGAACAALLSWRLQARS